MRWDNHQIYITITTMRDRSLIIFDCDGVLRSASWEGLFKAYLLIAKYLGKDHRGFFKNINEFKKWWNPDWKENNKALGIIDSEATDKIFYSCYEPYLALFPWVPDILKKLSRKYTIAMVTNATDKSVRNSLGKMTEHFSLIAGSEHVKKLKPDPEGVNFILKNLDIHPSEALMIGDMRVDVLAGKNAGTKVGVVSWGLGEWEDLIKLSPDYKFEKPEDLLSI